MSNAAPTSSLDRLCTIEVARITEMTAIATARFCGRGDERSADSAAVDAMHLALSRLQIHGKVVIGEGEAGDVAKLYIGEQLGAGDDLEVDIATDPLEGTTICAKAMPNALSVLAISERGGLLNVPAIYMDKIAIGPGYATGLVDLDASPADNLNALAAAKGVPISEIRACILDRPRHGALIAQVREAGAGIQLIPAGDISGVIWATDPEKSGVDIYLGSGGAPEGVLAAAALRCIGGQMQARLKPKGSDDERRVQAMGITDLQRKYDLSDLASGDVIFSATGVTDGSLMAGVDFRPGIQATETLLLRAATKTKRLIKTMYRV